MATHTGGENSGVRKFQIGRENSAKDGRPYWMEFLPALPFGDTGIRKFETRNGRTFELFKGLSGYLIGLHTEKKTFGTDVETWLIIEMEDDLDRYKIEIGKIEGQYSIDLMKRLLHPYFDPDLRLHISPYAIAKDDGGQNMGVMAISGIDGKLLSKKGLPHLAGIPEPSVTVLGTGKKVYDFYPIASWLMQEVGSKILPKLKKDSGPMPDAETVQVPQGPKVEPQPIPDDLPF